MFRVNENYLKLPGSYLFSTIAKKVAAYQKENPDKKLIRLGIGDVTLPIAPAIIDAMHKAVDEMGHAETFHGYAPDLGYAFLRETIAKKDFQERGCQIEADEDLQFLTVQRAIPVTFRKSSAQTARLQFATRFILFMWIPMLWPAVPVSMIQKREPGAM